MGKQACKQPRECRGRAFPEAPAKAVEQGRSSHICLKACPPQPSMSYSHDLAGSCGGEGLCFKKHQLWWVLTRREDFLCRCAMLISFTPFLYRADIIIPTLEMKIPPFRNLAQVNKILLNSVIEPKCRTWLRRTGASLPIYSLVFAESSVCTRLHPIIAEEKAALQKHSLLYNRICHRILLLYCHCSYLATKSHPTLCNPMDYSLPGSLCPWGFLGKNTGVGCCFLLQGIFPT